MLFLEVPESRLQSKYNLRLLVIALECVMGDTIIDDYLLFTLLPPGVQILIVNLSFAVVAVYLSPLVPSVQTFYVNCVVSPFVIW